MKKTLQLVLLLLLGYSTKAQTTTSLFPLLNPTDNKEIYVKDYTPENSKPNKGFLKRNIDYFETGKYFLSLAGYNINYLDYPSLEVKSNNLLDNYSSIIVSFSGYYPVNARLDDFDRYRFYSEFEDNKDKIAKNTIENYYSLNEYFKSEIYNIIKDKKAYNIIVLDLLKNKLSYSDNFEKSLILQLNLEDIEVWVNDGNAYPDYATYSLSVLNFKGDIVKKYNQVLFFEALKKHSDYDKIVKATIKQAFFSLLNQFLNDTKSKEQLKILGNQKLDEITKKKYEINKFQIDLLNIKLEKNQIISKLNWLGVNMEGLKNYTPINSSSLYTYNANYSNEINQQGSSAAVLAGGIVNAIEANAQRKRIQKNNLIGDKLKMRFHELDEEEKRITAAIPPEILNSPAVLFLPNNADLNQYMQAATQSYNQKSTAASTNLTQQTSKMMSDWKAENDAMNAQMQKSSLSPESSAVTNGANGTTTTPDGNSPEAMQCSKRTKEQWRNTSVAYKKFMTTERTQANGYRSQKDLIEMTLANCGQFIPQNEQDVLRKEILNLNKVISDLENSGGVNRFDAPPPSTNNTQTPSPTPIPQQSSGTGAVIAR